MYINAVIDAFADEIDYAQLVKIYGSDTEGQSAIAGAMSWRHPSRQSLGDPEQAHISTSFVERQISTCG